MNRPVSQPLESVSQPARISGLPATSISDRKIPGGWTECQLVVGKRSLNILLPADPTEFLNQLDEMADPHVADPYWSAVWSAAPALADRVVQHRWPPGTRALELGCGVGLAGLAALLAGVPVTFSDYIDEAVSLALENSVRNELGPATGLHLDWRNPPHIDPYDLVLASDVLYEHGLHADLLATLDRVLANDGCCWIGDPMRSASTDFADLARQRGYEVDIQRDGEPSSGTGTGTFQLLVLQRRQPN